MDRVAERKQVRQAMAWFRAHEEELRRLQLELVQIPAPPFGEAARGKWLEQRFLERGLEGVQVDEVGNVLGLLRGTRTEAGVVAISAHIDTVFPAGSPLEVRREGNRIYGPGISDNGAGVIALLALAGALRDSAVRPGSSILFVGNVGEEGEGDLRGMRHLFTASPYKDGIAYTVVLDGATTDTIVTQGLGSRRFEITVHGPGGHSWSDFGAPNPILILSHVLESLSRLPLPGEPRTTLNVGVIGGGTSVNSIPESAWARIDIRSASVGEIDRLEGALREIVAVEAGSKSARAAGVRFEVKIIGSRPAAELDPRSRIVEVMQAVDEHLGNPSHLHRASTDANIPFSMGAQAISIGAGGKGGDAHTLHEWYDATGRDLGLKRALLAVLTLAGVEE
ncbi:MAG: M20/M25/M40 family metallo-hydrolase [Terriglobales bacterium]